MKKIFVLCLFYFPLISFAQSYSPSFKELVGDIDYSQYSDFILLDHSGLNVNKSHMFLHKEVVDALKNIQKQFNKDFKETPFIILSATRNFEAQKNIWNFKWNALNHSNKTSVQKRSSILEYSSLPSTSRHHWGTDVDLVFINPKNFETAIGKKIYAWFKKKLPEYGFAQCFNAGRQKGYQEEKWHWSYLPLAKIYIKNYKIMLQKNPQFLIKYIRKVEGFSLLQISDNDILKLVQTYVFNINPQCL